MLDGDIARLKRQRADNARLAQQTGLFAQIELKAHESVLKRMLNGEKPRTSMTGKQIGSAMRALAARAGR